MKVLFCGDLDADEAAGWQSELARACPEVEWLDPDAARRQSADIEVAVVANPKPGSLQGLPRLRLIQSLWAGVDRLLADPTLPTGVPIVRMVDPAMSRAMAETALWATLALQRGFFDYARQQRQGLWLQRPQRRGDEVPVLLLGYGEMGRTAAQAIAAMGFPVTAWRRGQGAARDASHGALYGAARDAFDARHDAPHYAPHYGPQNVPQNVPHDAGHDAVCEALHDARLDGVVRVMAGPAALWQALPAAAVVINLLPLSEATRGLLDRRFFAALPGGAGVVNLGRGAQLVDADLLAALDAGHLRHAVLDVFDPEPLPAGHRFWTHPKVTLLPHVAALTDARSAAAVVAGNLRAFAAGVEVRIGVVDRGVGY